MLAIPDNKAPIAATPPIIIPRFFTQFFLLLLLLLTWNFLPVFFVAITARPHG
jgi:hypothetical protein